MTTQAQVLAEQAGVDIWGFVRVWERGAIRTQKSNWRLVVDWLHEHYDDRRQRAYDLTRDPAVAQALWRELDAEEDELVAFHSNHYSQTIADIHQCAAEALDVIRQTQVNGEWWRAKQDKPARSTQPSARIFG